MKKPNENPSKNDLYYSLEELSVIFDRSERQIHRWLKKWEEAGCFVQTKTKNRKKLYYLPHVMHYRELDLLEAFD